MYPTEYFLTTAPPEIQPVNDITVDEGDSAVLNCSASGFPVPNVVWIKNDREYPGQMVSPYITKASNEV